MFKPLTCLLIVSIAAATMGFSSALGAGEPAANEQLASVEQPVAVDKRLAIELFAAEPQIVTPTGIAVDSRGRVLVIESHTHFRPQNYQGPPSDRIRLLEDTNGDGRADRISTFFEGTQYTMNLAIDRQGAVYVATRNEVFRLRDNDGDGRAEERTSIARLETQGNYPHNGLSGFAFDFAGDVYFGLGENLGADYRLVGSDGSAASGGGEGGSIYRCRPDGSKLRRVATGFWNPFHVCFDAFGRLFAVDNDPDSRPPCRLLHIVGGGDYGYRYRNGRKGIHPFTAWNGELPGTLPMTAGTGEAPSGVVAYESDGLPDDYRGTLLATSWGDHRIERFRLQSRGASFHAIAEPIVTCGENFRPVGIALAPDGSLYVSDWVDKSYELHGKGRVWRIRTAAASQPGQAQSAKPDRPSDARQALASPHGPLREHAARELSGQGEVGLAFLRTTLEDHDNPRVRAAALAALVAAGKCDDRVRQVALADGSTDVRAMAARILPASNALREMLDESQPALVRAEAMRRADAVSQRGKLIKGLVSTDPFLRQAARQGLKRTSDHAALLAELAVPDARQRLEIALVFRERDDAAARAVLPRLLNDADPAVRFVAVQWVAEQRLGEFRKLLEEGLAKGATSRDLFEAYLAALERLDGVARAAKDELRGEDYVATTLFNSRAPIDVRVRALRVLRPDHPALTGKFVKLLDGQNDDRLRLEAVRTLRERAGDQAADLLALVAGDARESVQIRAEAVVGLSPRNAEHRKLLLTLATGAEPTLRDEALRSLRGAGLTVKERTSLDALAEATREVKDLVALVMRPDRSGDSARADAGAGARARAEWLKLLDGPADAQAGERIFFHPSGPGCFRCHQIDGRGGRIGPDLSNVARVLSRERLLESLLEPSKEIAPQFVSFSVECVDGTAFTGLLVGEDSQGVRTYADSQGKSIALAAAKIVRSQPSKASIMPDGLLKNMTRAEFRDLVAYLIAPRE